MSIAVRPVTLGDVPGLRECIGAVASERRHLAITGALPLQEIALFVARVVDRGWAYFVADEGERIIGWCDITGKPGQAHAHVGLLGMGVREGFRRQGLGARLMGSTLDAAAAVFEQVELSVYASNAPAQALYRRFGFVERGRFPRGRKVDGDYDDVILMSLEFPTP